jgi:hypothetical protein
MGGRRGMPIAKGGSFHDGEHREGGPWPWADVLVPMLIRYFPMTTWADRPAGRLARVARPRGWRR